MTRVPPVPPTGERARLTPFIALPEPISPRDQRDLMERPFFSLAKTKRIAPIRYRTADIELCVEALPACGMATIWDADVLIWAASQIVEALDHGLAPSRLIHFTPYQLLKAVGRGTTQRHYRLLKGALRRLQSTVVRTTIRQGEQWRLKQFSWLNEWGELVDGKGRNHGLEIILPDWFYQGVIDRSLVLTIDPAYFRLSGGIERWLYRTARKHAGHQPAGWIFDFRHLHAKSGSLARFSDFALDLRRIAGRQPLPGYRVTVRRWPDQEEALHIVPLPARGAGPALSTGPVGNPVPISAAVGEGVDTSGAAGVDISGARDSILRAQRPEATLCSNKGILSCNVSNQDSNQNPGGGYAGVRPPAHHGRSS